jgi:hypothetical protein
MYTYGSVYDEFRGISRKKWPGGDNVEQLLDPDIQNMNFSVEFQAMIFVSSGNSSSSFFKKNPAVEP